MRKQERIVSKTCAVVFTFDDLFCHSFIRQSRTGYHVPGILLGVRDTETNEKSLPDRSSQQLGTQYTRKEVPLQQRNLADATNQVRPLSIPRSEHPDSSCNALSTCTRTSSRTMQCSCRKQDDRANPNCRTSTKLDLKSSKVSMYWEKQTRNKNST